MKYTKDGILSQMQVAFGQGTGAARVSQDACLAVADRYGDRIDDAVLAAWEGIGVQILERMRAIGRTAAALAALEGGTSVQFEKVRLAIRAVERTSKTSFCPPPDVAISARKGPRYTREGVVAQLLVAFGQGTGALRVSQEAAQVIVDRYAPLVDEAVVARWEALGVQVLERMRAIGRLAATQAVLQGGTAIPADKVRLAARAVERESKTPLCPSTERITVAVAEPVPERVVA